MHPEGLACTPWRGNLTPREQTRLDNDADPKSRIPEGKDSGRSRHPCAVDVRNDQTSDAATGPDQRENHCDEAVDRAEFGTHWRIAWRFAPRVQADSDFCLGR